MKEEFAGVNCTDSAHTLEDGCPALAYVHADSSDTTEEVEKRASSRGASVAVGGGGSAFLALYSKE